MRWFVAALIALALTSPAAADSCGKSREYLLEGLAGDLPEPTANYQNLFKICQEAASLANVKDAYLLRDGGIAITPKNNTLTATAETLSQFCERFPRTTARFLTPREQKQWLTISLIVTLSSTGVTSCKQIRGLI